MTISIWIILVILAAIGFLFVYKKNKHKIIPSKDNSEKTKTNYVLTDFDKMLDHVTSNNEPEDENSAQIDEIDINSNTRNEEESNNDNINSSKIKDSVLGSIILERKKKKT